MSATAYRQWLADADIVLVAYNFDAATRRYLQFSFANKVPEALASGAAVLAYGPALLATVAFLSESGAAEVVTEEGIDAITARLAALCARSTRSRAHFRSAVN